MKKVLLIVLAVLVIAQFIRPSKNSGSADGPKDISHAVAVTPEVDGILRKACYDCHSNHTEYPWYTNVQPVGWWMNHHVNEGKEHLNFSEFADYQQEDRPHIMHEIVEQVEEGEMPIGSYTWIHAEARLSKQERETLVQWAQANGGRR
jgi:hypothetical protein